MVTLVDDFTTWKVMPDRSGWVIKQHPGGKHESRHAELAGAIEEAERLAVERAPGQVLVKNQDGSVKYAIMFRRTDVDPRKVGLRHP